MARSLICLLACFLSNSLQAAEPLRAGFAEFDITPTLGVKPIYLAGFGHNRKATGIHDRLAARAVVLQDGATKIALVCADAIGLFHTTATRIRGRLAGFTYVLVSSTHNHEGPDTMGLWGPSPFSSGLDPAYLAFVEDQIVKAVCDAEQALQATSVEIGTARAPELLHDGREPFIKHDELVALRFLKAGTTENAGLIVQWNCHPETLDGKNTEISADFIGATVAALKERYHCPVVYLTGTVGGLMTSLHVPVKDASGKLLADGTFEKTTAYGRLVAELAVTALAEAKPLRLTPLQVRHRAVYLPLDNKLYLLARQLGVLHREAFAWKGDPYRAEPIPKDGTTAKLCLRTEVARLRFGELDVAAFPGELYPELVLDQVQDPPDPGADYPDAPIEPGIYKQLPGPYRMVIGLANDEIGYIIPKRQWDEKPPFCYGRTRMQYGEINSVGPETAPILCNAFKELAALAAK